MRHATGTILKYNTSWKAGMHYNYIFFKVSHETKKGYIMGHLIASKRENESFDHDHSTDRWIIEGSRKISKLRRLKHPQRWESVNEKELIEGIKETSCVY